MITVTDRLIFQPGGNVYPPKAGKGRNKGNKPIGKAKGRGNRRTTEAPTTTTTTSTTTVPPVKIII